MKILLNVLTALLLTSQVAYAQSYIGGRKVTEAEVLTFRGIPSTKVSRSNQAVIYQSSVDGKLKCSEDGGAFTDCIGGEAEPTDKITEGNTEAEVVDTGSDGHFKVTTEGTERLRVLANGNVGIGTSAPAEKLSVSGTANTVETVAKITNNGTGRGLVLSTPNSTNVSLLVTTPASTSLTTGRVFSGSVTGDAFGKFMFYADGKFGIGGGTADRDIFLSRHATNVMKISSDASTGSGSLVVTGNVGIGTTAPSAKLHALSTTEQLRLGYDSSNYVSTTVGSTGAVTFDAVGSGASFTFSDPVSVTGITTLTGTGGGKLLLQDTDTSGYTLCTALNGTLSCCTDDNQDGTCD
jgi:hypothetical protein